MELMQTSTAPKQSSKMHELKNDLRSRPGLVLACASTNLLMMMVMPAARAADADDDGRIEM